MLSGHKMIVILCDSTGSFSPVIDECAGPDASGGGAFDDLPSPRRRARDAGSRAAARLASPAPAVDGLRRSARRRRSVAGSPPPAAVIRERWIAPPSRWHRRRPVNGIPRAARGGRCGRECPQVLPMQAVDL